MKLLVLGASGGCGKWICKLAVKRGHHVRALVRPTTHCDLPTKIEIVRGNVLNKTSLKTVLANRDGVLSALGIKRKSPKNPWSELVSPPDLTTRVSKLLVELLSSLGIQRVIAISAAGVGESINQVNPIIRWMIKHSKMAASYSDLEGMESVFKESSLEWVAVRPTTLTNGAPTGQVREIDYYGLLNRVSRGDVASWMLDTIESPIPISQHTPMITS